MLSHFHVIPHQISGKAVTMHTIIFFVPDETQWLQRLMHITAQRLPCDAMTACRTAEELVESILTISSERSTLVLSMLTHRDLALVLPLKGMLKDVRKILILPDESNETLSDALPLRACYQTTVNGNQDDVLAVLEKISRYMKRRSSGADHTRARAVAGGKDHL
jgi:ActR/RegA family two-component response regulator